MLLPIDEGCNRSSLTARRGLEPFARALGTRFGTRFSTIGTISQNSVPSP